MFVRMHDDAPAPDARQLEMLSAMTECAFALGKVASDIAQNAADADLKRFLAATAEFRHCFFAVRMGIRLSQVIRAGAISARTAAAPAPRPERERLESERPEAAEPPEHHETAGWPERSERLEAEGDYEPVSLSRYLKTLGLVADRAEARGDELPPHIRDTTLPTLRGLLREANPSPDGASPATTVLSRPPKAPASRSRLLTSTGAVGLPAPTLLPPRRSDSS